LALNCLGIEVTDSTESGQSGTNRDSAWKSDFKLLWTGSALSQFGTVNATLTAPLLALTLTQSPVFAGWVTAAGTLPRILLHLPVGVIVDHSDRRRIMIASMVAQAVLAAVMVGAVFFFGGSVVLLPLVAVAQGVCVVFYNTAETTVVPGLVPPESLPQAMSKNEARNHGAGLLGRPFGGFLFDLHHGLPFLMDAVSSTLSAVLLLRIRKSAFPTSTRRRNLRRPGMRRELREGFSFLRSDAFLMRVLVVCTLANFFFQIVGLVLILLAHERALPSWMTGSLIAASGLGGVLGSLTASRFLRDIRPQRVILLCVWSWLLLSAILAVSDQDSPFYVAVVLPLAWGGIGFTGAYINVALALYQASRVPPELLGRVISVSRFFSGGAVPLGALASGYVIAGLGTRFAVLLVALVIGALALGMSYTALVRPPLSGLGGQISDGREDLVAELAQPQLKTRLHRLRRLARARQRPALGRPRDRLAQRLQPLVACARAQRAQPLHRLLRLPYVLAHLAHLVRKIRAVKPGGDLTAHLQDEAHREAEFENGRDRRVVGQPQLALACVFPVVGTLLGRGEPGVLGPRLLGDDAPDGAGQGGQDGAAAADERHESGQGDQDSSERFFAAVR
jgi:MFS family permease